MNLEEQQCQPCRKGTAPLTAAQYASYLDDLTGWRVDEIDGEERLVKQYAFDDFRGALDFATAVGELAEDADHHPLMEVTWGQVTLHWWTHAIGGLHLNDFIMAARSDAVQGRVK